MDKNPNQNPNIDFYPAEQDISLRDIIVTVGEYLRLLFKRWYIILAAFVLFNTLFLLKFYYIDKIAYSGNIMVLLNNNSASASLGGIMGGLGLGLGSEDGSALDKVTVVAQSQDILGKCLLRPTKLKAKNGILANYMLDSMNFHTLWANSKEPILKEFKYFEHTNIDSCTAGEWRALNAIRQNLLLEKFSFDVSEAGILSIGFTSDKQTVICEILNYLYEELDIYYMSNQMGAEQNTFNSLRYQRDSINGALASAISRVARYRDANQGTLFSTDQVPIATAQQDISFLTAMKAEIMKNYGMAKISIESKQPYLRFLDAPREPLAPILPSRLKSVLIGSFLGIFLSCLGIILHRIFKNTMQA